MLRPGDRVPPAIRVWVGQDEGPRPLIDVLGADLVLLCFYLFDWSPT